MARLFSTKDIHYILGNDASSHMEYYAKVACKAKEKYKPLFFKPYINVDEFWINVDEVWIKFDECWINFDDFWIQFDEFWINVDECWINVDECWMTFD